MNPHENKHNISELKIYEAITLTLNSFSGKGDLTFFKDLNYFQGSRRKSLIVTIMTFYFDIP